MNYNQKILFSVPTIHHVEIALDELTGMQNLGFECDQFNYAAKEGVKNKLGRLFVTIENAFKLVRKAKSFAPDIVYFNSRLELIAGLRDCITISIFKVFYWRKVLLIVKSHGSDLDILEDSGFLTSKIIIPYLKKNVSGWLFLSSEEKSQVIIKGSFEKERVFVAKNIVRANQFIKDIDFKRKLNIPADHKVLLFVGRIIREKGVFEVIESFAKLKDEYKIHLIIIGDGPDSPELKNESHKLGLENRIIFTGFIPEKDVIPFYSNCDILVFPTYCNEGFAMSLFNSVSAGMAIITTNIRAASDYLSDPSNCLWVRPINNKDINDSLRKLLTNNDLINKMKNNNLNKSFEFGVETVSLELSNNIKKLEKHVTYLGN